VMIQFRLVEAEPGSSAVISGLRAVRTGPRTSNYDSTSTAVTVGVAGAIVGSASTLAIQWLARAGRRRMTRR